MELHISGSVEQRKVVFLTENKQTSGQEIECLQVLSL